MQDMLVYLKGLMEIINKMVTINNNGTFDISTEAKETLEWIASIEARNKEHDQQLKGISLRSTIRELANGGNK